MPCQVVTFDFFEFVEPIEFGEHSHDAIDGILGATHLRPRYHGRRC